MKVQALGRLSGEVLLFGGPYSNLQATEALMATAAARGIAADHVICTGDLVAYCGAPRETVARIRAWGCTVVAGNCETQLAEGALDCGCGFEAGTACDLLSRGWFAHADAQVGAEARRWMAGLPDIVTFEHAGRSVAVLHGGARANNRFLWPSDPDSAFAAEIAHLREIVGPVDAVIAGHCGLAFERVVAGVSWINAGVIGLPPHDGRPQTRYAVLGADGARILRLAYDAAAARRAMEEAGLTQGYHAALTSGIWPSEEILPDALRRG
ncbi:Calcineurin-like phosphoesterase superfamily domain protein [Pseudoruegeria aquimaris]|uniref:Calcineurin-like phosphoesterase superfamily domain protein n=1 Tax=Pseudoruegeria aquimaris TaxID=393663 RepID=A0A1Y5RB71_9RHOB|nr:metallophosphoesterase family protein [Pseudoruegeria aquimaris]SLN10632.1 Calcineurin-like phosphoesterase superfamily domain protein [Pseudoruegeria aquimaris]